MPTKEWLEQHQKVQAYLSEELFQKLSDWMKENNITQISQALIIILEHYLNDNPSLLISSKVLTNEVETLKAEVALIKAFLLEAGAKTLGSSIQQQAVNNNLSKQQANESK